MMISTQVVDTSRGTPVSRIAVDLDRFIEGRGWVHAGHSVTNEVGMIQEFGEAPEPGIYRLMFDVAAYAPDLFFPSITVTMDISDAHQRYHIPLQLSRYGYSVYRAPGR